jgi:hypothetical protein
MMDVVFRQLRDTVMPLQDHFQPPLSVRRHWHAFHNAWATYLSSQLNALLPSGYFAEGNVQFSIEIDVATWDETASYGEGACSTDWSPTAATLTIPLPLLEDIVEVQVFNNSEGPLLAAAIELVSPANKDRPAHRDAFVSKCAAYVQQGVGLIIVDVVTGRNANLHAELLNRLRSPEAVTFAAGELYAVAYHPVRHGDQSSLDIWPEVLMLGQVLPSLPLWLRGGPVLPVDLEVAYERTCEEQRVPRIGA